MYVQYMAVTNVLQFTFHHNVQHEKKSYVTDNITKGRYHVLLTVHLYIIL